MKQVELAQQLGISKSYLSMILSGQRKGSPALMRKLSSLEVHNFEAKSSLRGRCPKPLDECTTKNLAGEEGFEPSLTDSESVVLPLDYSPVHLNNIAQSYAHSKNKDYLTQQA